MEIDLFTSGRPQFVESKVRPDEVKQPSRDSLSRAAPLTQPDIVPASVASAIPELLQYLRAHNANQLPAVHDFTVLMKAVISNIRSHPGDELYRTFHPLKENFQRKIAILDGAFEFLEGIGYQRIERSSGVCYILPESAATPSMLEAHLQALQSTMAGGSGSVSGASGSAASGSNTVIDLTRDNSFGKPAGVSRGGGNIGSGAASSSGARNDDGDSPAILDGVPMLVDMGFNASEALTALRQAKGDLAKAVALLTPAAAPLVREDSMQAMRKLAAELDRADENKRRADEAASAALAYRWMQQAAREEAEQKDRLLAISMQDDLRARELMQAEVMSGARVPLDLRNIGLLGDQYQTDQRFSCPICYEDYPIHQVMVFGCRHTACITCSREHLKVAINGICCCCVRFDSISCIMKPRIHNSLVGCFLVARWPLQRPALSGLPCRRLPR